MTGEMTPEELRKRLEEIDALTKSALGLIRQAEFNHGAVQEQYRKRVREDIIPQIIRITEEF